MKSNIKIKVLLALILMSVGRVFAFSQTTVDFDMSQLPRDISLTGTYLFDRNVQIYFSKRYSSSRMPQYSSTDDFLKIGSSIYIFLQAKDGYVITQVSFQEQINDKHHIRNYNCLFHPELGINIEVVSPSQSTIKTETWTADNKCGPTNKIVFDTDGQIYVTRITVTYEPVTTNNNTLSISSAGYATYYNELPYFMPNGVDGYTITSAPQEGEITLYKACPSGSYVPENTALLIKGNPGTYPLYYHPDATPFTITNNWLHGDPNTTYHSGNGTYYKLSYDSNGENLGFYRAVLDGSSITNNAGKCYLLIPSTSSVKSISLSELEDNYILGIDYVTIKPQNQAYNIFGMPVKDDAKGIVIKNGKKYFNR